MVAGEEAANMEVVVAGILPMGEIMKTMGLNEIGSSYYSNGKGDAPRDGRNPRNRAESAPRAIKDDPYDLVGHLAFEYKI
jgi:hypothetical protein